MKGHWPEFQCWNYQLNRSKNSLKDQQPRKNKAITKIHTLVLKILKNMKKRRKNKEYFYGSFWKAFDVIQINSCWATECLIFFLCVIFIRKLVIFDIITMSNKLKTPPSKLIVKAKKNDNHQYCSITIKEGKIKLKTNLTEKKKKKIAGYIQTEFLFDDRTL